MKYTKQKKERDKQATNLVNSNLLAMVIPSKQEEELIKLVCSNAVRIIQECLDKNNVNAKVEIGGSVAKGTWLKDINDIDVYIKFDRGQYSAKNGVNISDVLHEALKTADLKALQRLHGSRDYFQFKLNADSRQFTIEVIPILDIARIQEAENITDVSPFHVRYVKRHAGLANEIRLTKAFCKANNLYGAESYIKGFSGYVLEVLTIYYGGFINLVKNVSVWGKGEVIDPSVYYKTKEDIIEKMNLSKQQSPLLLVDPVQEERNAAAAVGIERYNGFIRAAKKYLKKPSIKFFVRKDFDINALVKKYKKQKTREIVVLKAIPKQGKRDIVGAKLLKCLERAKRAFEENEFRITARGWNWDCPEVCWLWFVFPKKALSKYYKHYGPPVKYKTRFGEFERKWSSYKKRILFERNISYVLLTRKYRKPADMLKGIIAKGGFSEYAHSIKLY